MNLGNGYTYVGNNPWTHVDPFGLQTYPETWLGWTGYYTYETLAGVVTIPRLMLEGLGGAVQWGMGKLFPGRVVESRDYPDSEVFLAQLDGGNSQYVPGLQGDLERSYNNTLGQVRNAAELGATGITGPLGTAIELGSAGVDAYQGNYLSAALPITVAGMRVCPSVRRAAARIDEGLGEFGDFLRLADELDVSSAQSGAVFYSGPGNRDIATAFAIEHGMTTLEMTPGGRWLDQQNLFGPDSPLTREDALAVWAKLSARFASEASGNVVGFVEGASPTGIFNDVEYPALLANPNIANVITGGN